MVALVKQAQNAACMGGNLNAFEFSVAKSLKERDHLQYLHILVDGRTIT
jgi:hypothetical protein